MCCQGRNSHADQNRCAGCCHDAVVRRSRNAHAKDNAAEHRQKEGNEEPSVGNRDDRIDQFVGKACHRDAAGNDAGNAAGCGHGNRASSACLQCIDALGQRNAVLLIEQAYNNSKDNGVARSLLHRHHVGRYPDDQHHERKEQVNLTDQNLEHRELFLRDSRKSELFRLQMNGDKDSGKIQHCRQDRTDNDIGIRNADKICHEEGCRTHDRRHDLTAGGGCGLNRTCKLRLVAGILHHRDRNRSGCYRIADRGAGYHAAKSRADDRNLGRSSGIFSCDAVCQLDEEIRDSGSLQEGTKDDKDHDIFRAHINGCREDTLLRIKEVAHKVPHAAKKRRIRQTDSQRVDQKESGNTQNRKANTSPCQLDEGCNTDDADHNLIGLEPGSLI